MCMNEVGFKQKNISRNRRTLFLLFLHILEKGPQKRRNDVMIMMMRKKEWARLVLIGRKEDNNVLLERKGKRPKQDLKTK